MRNINLLPFVIVFFGAFLKSQVSLTIQEVDYEKFEYYIPQHQRALNEEIRNKGHILEITLINDSDKEITLPLDTISYALPYTDKINLYYNKPENIVSNPDIFNSLGIYAFIYQDKQFKEQELATDPFYEEKQLFEKAQISKLRLEKINEWRQIRKIDDQKFATYNWYLVKNMITIKPNQKFKYKIHFNPFSKMLNSLGYEEFYYGLKPETMYEVSFKIILNKNLYQYLTKEDKSKYPNLFMGTISSNQMKFK